ncbi:MAG: nitrilase-related carbon-nitrogen hydrolase [Atopobiaceae bacterium]
MKGDLTGKHRKMRVSVAERLVWGDGQGSMMSVFKTELVNLGGCQCWGHDVLLDKAAMNGQNEQVHVASWPGYYDDDIAGKAYAISTGTFVLMSCSVAAFAASARCPKQHPNEGHTTGRHSKWCSNTR